MDKIKYPDIPTLSLTQPQLVCPVAVNSCSKDQRVIAGEIKENPSVETWLWETYWVAESSVTKPFGCSTGIKKRGMGGEGVCLTSRPYFKIWMQRLQPIHFAFSIFCQDLPYFSP